MKTEFCVSEPQALARGCCPFSAAVRHWDTVVDGKVAVVDRAGTLVPWRPWVGRRSAGRSDRVGGRLLAYRAPLRVCPTVLCRPALFSVRPGRPPYPRLLAGGRPDELVRAIDSPGLCPLRPKRMARGVIAKPTGSHPGGPARFRPQWASANQQTGRLLREAFSRLRGGSRCWPAVALPASIKRAAARQGLASSL